MSGSAKLGGPYSERRAMPRYSFITTADIIELSTKTRISGRVSEISRSGCYVDILNTLPKGTPIRVCISADGRTFESAGTIIYVQENMGMGVGFVDPSPDQQHVLDEWLAALASA
ncbi:MAG TPA: PilZ domain-containing protein [Candidatus Acidoferrales bacterium]